MSEQPAEQVQDEQEGVEQEPVQASADLTPSDANVTEDENEEGSEDA